jgi:hypothetical protein
MVGVAQLVESWNVAPDVAGSSPVAHPIYFDFSAPVAQLDRVPDFESVGRRFESCRAHSLTARGKRRTLLQKVLLSIRLRRSSFKRVDLFATSWREIIIKLRENRS